MRINIPSIITGVTCLLLIFTFSCTEKFFLDIDSETSILVVDGRITNENTPYEVRLFRTVSLIEADTLQPESNALITLQCDNGRSDILLEKAPGIYRSQDSLFIGEVGRSYWIEIQTKDDKHYESRPIRMMPPYSIDTVYGKQTTKLINVNQKQEAIQFYFDAHESTNNTNYLKWEYEEAWEWRTPYEYPKYKNPTTTCYPVAYPNRINIFDATIFGEKIIHQLELSHVLDDEVQLNYEYYLNLRCYSISSESHKFWKNIKAIHQSNGSIYKSLPANVQGNIIPCDNECEAIGFFDVASVTKSTVSFHASLYNINFPSIPEECRTFDINLSDSAPKPDPDKYIIIAASLVGAHTIKYRLRRKHCYDCIIKYDAHKPSFWP